MFISWRRAASPFSWHHHSHGPATYSQRVPYNADEVMFGQTSNNIHNPATAGQNCRLRHTNLLLLCLVHHCFPDASRSVSCLPVRSVTFTLLSCRLNLRLVCTGGQYERMCSTLQTDEFNCRTDGQCADAPPEVPAAEASSE